MEIEKQNGVINALEREMLRLKAMYETAVEQRNFAGVQLIDRNDELCVLYEKSNIQETTLTVCRQSSCGGCSCVIIVCARVLDERYEGKTGIFRHCIHFAKQGKGCFWGHLAIPRSP